MFLNLCLTLLGILLPLSSTLDFKCTVTRYNGGTKYSILNMPFPWVDRCHSSWANKSGGIIAHSSKQISEWNGNRTLYTSTCFDTLIYEEECENMIERHTSHCTFNCSGTDQIHEHKDTVNATNQIQGDNGSSLTWLWGFLGFLPIIIIIVILIFLRLRHLCGRWFPNFKNLIKRVKIRDVEYSKPVGRSSEAEP